MGSTANQLGGEMVEEYQCVLSKISVNDNGTVDVTRCKNKCQFHNYSSKNGTSHAHRVETLQLVWQASVIVPNAAVCNPCYMYDLKARQQGAKSVNESTVVNKRCYRCHLDVLMLWPSSSQLISTQPVAVSVDNRTLAVPMQARDAAITSTDSAAVDRGEARALCLTCACADYSGSDNKVTEKPTKRDSLDNAKAIAQSFGLDAQQQIFNEIKKAHGELTEESAKEVESRYDGIRLLIEKCPTWRGQLETVARAASREHHDEKSPLSVQQLVSIPAVVLQAAMTAHTARPSCRPSVLRGIAALSNQRTASARKGLAKVLYRSGAASHAQSTEYRQRKSRHDAVDLFKELIEIQSVQNARLIWVWDNFNLAWLTYGKSNLLDKVKRTFECTFELALIVQCRTSPIPLPAPLSKTLQDPHLSVAVRALAGRHPMIVEFHHFTTRASDWHTKHHARVAHALSSTGCWRTMPTPITVACCPVT